MAGAFLLTAACGGGDSDDKKEAASDDEATVTTTAPDDAAAKKSNGHPCDLLPLAEVNRITGLVFDKTERKDATDTANVDSCTYSLFDSTATPPGTASVSIAINRPSGSRKLENTAGGSFLASLKLKGGDHSIAGGISGASETGTDGDANFATAAARFGEDRVVSVQTAANVSVVNKGYDSEPKAIDVLKALVAAGA